LAWWKGKALWGDFSPECNTELSFSATSLSFIIIWVPNSAAAKFHIHKEHESIMISSIDKILDTYVECDIRLKNITIKLRGEPNFKSTMNILSSTLNSIVSASNKKSKSTRNRRLWKKDKAMISYYIVSCIKKTSQSIPCKFQFTFNL